MQKKQDDSQLTEREREILELTGKGLSNKEIARHLNISHNTVKTHLHRVYVKVEKSGRIKAFHAHQENRNGERSEDRI
jgi:LuxR family maltose regulon positive regulatory protein